jgi:hypothetical protein
MISEPRRRMLSRRLRVWGASFRAEERRTPVICMIPEKAAASFAKTAIHPSHEPIN